VDTNEPEEIGDDVGSHLLTRIDHAHSATATPRMYRGQASDESQLERFEDEDKAPALPHLKEGGLGLGTRLGDIR
jgi:hypothetical protein